MKFYGTIFKKLILLTVFLINSIVSFAQNNPSHDDILWVAEPNHKDWLYKLGEEANITIRVYRYGVLLDAAVVNYSIGEDMMPEEKQGKVTLNHGVATVPIGTMNTPGFRDCKLSLNYKNKRYSYHIKVGFEPEKLTPYTKFPNDFKSFWDDALKKASTCPMVVEREFVSEFSNDKINCYLLKIQSVQKGHFFYAYLTLPKKQGKFPIVISPPGAGIKPMNPSKDLFYAENGFIRLDMEIHGIRPNLDAHTYSEISKAFGNKNNSYLVNGLDDKEHYYMKGVYLSCIRAVDYLVTLPEWDGKNLIAQGGSQGGALALITTGLDKRVTACAANHPALSDMARYKINKAGGYPHLFTTFEGMDTPEKLETLEYFDVVNFAKLIKVPVFMTWGFNDNVCPPTTSYIVYNTIQSPKEALITPVNEHWISLETRYNIMDWIKTTLK
ncbi:acetylxylan esterase [Pseudotamlana carrageenivorans]|uniref:Acetylxylan esterase n=1 Tax=Pseudotamlana carrageenivorans TaxID=2069432 RepID=A0A2I7SMC8_9FLAO|nr:acetylxylan esterase [Tamlana carrageenivorans]AUS07042.1 acetylxylan esterase [Tamlana carrageenivorans]